MSTHALGSGQASRGEVVPHPSPHAEQNVPTLITDLPGIDVTLGQAQLQKLNLYFAFADEKIYVAEARAK